MSVARPSACRWRGWRRRRPRWREINSGCLEGQIGEGRIEFGGVFPPDSLRLFGRVRDELMHCQCLTGVIVTAGRRSEAGHYPPLPGHRTPSINIRNEQGVKFHFLSWDSFGAGQISSAPPGRGHIGRQPGAYAPGYFRQALRANRIPWTYICIYIRTPRTGRNLSCARDSFG